MFKRLAVKGAHYNNHNHILKSAYVTAESSLTREHDNSFRLIKVKQYEQTKVKPTQ